MSDDRNRIRPPKRCGLCKFKDLYLLYSDILVEDAPVDAPHLRSLWACARCHAYWTHLPPFVESREYYLQKPESDHLLLEHATRRFRSVRRAVEHALGRHHYRLLDVGCATGSHFDVYGESVERFGVEPALSAVPTLQSRGATWIGPSIRDAPASSFDVVTSLDVIEHLEKPRPFFDRVDRCLTAGGVVAFVTGDIDSLSARWGGRRWLYYALPEHCSFLSAQALDRYWVGERGYEFVAKTRLANQDADLAYFRRFLLACAREALLKAMPQARTRAIELAGRARFPFFYDNMLVTFRKPLVPS